MDWLEAEAGEEVGEEAGEEAGDEAGDEAGEEGIVLAKAATENFCVAFTLVVNLYQGSGCWSWSCFYYLTIVLSTHIFVFLGESSA